MKNKAFTIIEIIIVVVIIGLLAAIALPVFTLISVQNDPRHMAEQAQHYKPRYADLHRAWVAAHQREISYEDWYTLYMQNLLPK